MTRKQPISKCLSEARKMPERKHGSKPYSIINSKAAEWLASNPSVRQWLFDACRKKGLIVFNPATRKWRGTDTVVNIPTADEPSSVDSQAKANELTALRPDARSTGGMPTIAQDGPGSVRGTKRASANQDATTALQRTPAGTVATPDGSFANN